MERSDELKNVVLDVYNILQSGDAQALEQRTAENGVVFIGTDPNEWWDSRAGTIEAFRAQSEALGGGGFAFRPGDIQAYTEGNVGWAADTPTITAPDGTEVALRFTLVFHKDNGQWRILQAHSSIGVPNEDVFGRDLYSIEPPS